MIALFIVVLFVSVIGYRMWRDSREFDRIIDNIDKDFKRQRYKFISRSNGRALIKRSKWKRRG